MKIIQELYDLKTVCLGWMQIWIFWILENCWNYKKIIEFSQESTILGKLQWSCGKLEPKLLKLGQFWSGEICKLLCTLNVDTPCIYNFYSGIKNGIFKDFFLIFDFSKVFQKFIFVKNS